MAIAFAANTSDAYPPIVERLYELLTDEPWEIRVSTKGSTGQALYQQLTAVFNYGGAWFDRCRKPFADDPQELAQAFNYVNRIIDAGSSSVNYQTALKDGEDGLHPISGLAFIKVGSFMAAKLLEKYGAERIRSYHTMGAISFFADYIRLYRWRAQKSRGYVSKIGGCPIAYLANIPPTFLCSPSMFTEAKAVLAWEEFAILGSEVEAIL